MLEIKPDKKLVTKQWLILSTISFVVLIAALLLQLLIPLDKNIYPDQVAVIVWPIAVGTIILMWLIAVPLIILWIKNLSYFIEEDRITIYKGILTKQQQNIPYRAITDFVLSRSLYDRIFDIGVIRIQTAGQSRNPTGYEGILSGLAKWEELHHELRSRLKGINSGVEPTGVAPVGSHEKSDDLRKLILEELKAIRKVLESK